MPILGTNTVVFTNLGLKFVGELRSGDSVLCLSRGQPVYSTIDSADHGLIDDAIWIYSDAGSLQMGYRTNAVTTYGPLSGEAMLAARDRRNIGRMDGAWPALEVYSPPRSRPAKDEQVVMENLTVILRSLSGVINGSSEVLRVGNHPKSQIRTFAKHVLRTAYFVEPGPAAWSWLIPEGPPDDLPTAPPLRDLGILLSTAWARWNSDGNPWLPTHHAQLAAITFAAVRWGDERFEMVFKPRYNPQSIELKASSHLTHHAKVQAVTVSRNARLSDVSLEDRGGYLIANGLACA